MGLYDRDYYRFNGGQWNGSPRRRRRLFGGMSGVAVLIIVNVVLFLANVFFTPENNFLTYLLAMHEWTIKNPVYWFEFLTYGFVHDPHNLWHIFGNMFVLFFFGPPIERKYGQLEFLLFYILAVLAGGVIWGLIHGFGPITNTPMLGASGAITAVVILFAVNYPNAQVFLFGILPLPAWVCGVFYVLFDAFGAANGTGNIAHEVHLAGAGFAAVYFFSRIRFTRILDSITGGVKKMASPKKDPKLRVWEEDVKPVKPDRLAEEVDRILRKINESGESSLTDHERATLRRASREYQKRQDK